jgi:hypothetical protein
MLGHGTKEVAEALVPWSVPASGRPCDVDRGGRALPVKDENFCIMIEGPN